MRTRSDEILWFQVASRAGLRVADDLIQGSVAFDNLAAGLSNALSSGLDAQQRAADWGLDIDASGNIVSVSSNGHLAIVLGAGAVPGLGPIWLAIASVVIGSAILQMKAANSAAHKARQDFADWLAKFSMKNPSW